MSWILSDEQTMALKAKAAAEGLSLEEWLRELVEAKPPILREPRRPIWDVIADNMQVVSTEDLAALPKDGLSQIDHYVYGTPKTTP